MVVWASLFQRKTIGMLWHTKTLNKIVLPIFWQQFGEGPHMGVMIQCSQMFDNLYLHNIEGAIQSKS